MNTIKQMRTKFTFFIGILGVTLLVISSIAGGLLMDDYSVKSQFLSETYAIDTEYGWILRVFGIIPSGVLLTCFAFMALKIVPQTRLITLGFIGLGIFYGIATVTVGIFPCDSGCNKEFINPSLSQIIHNLAGFLTYLCVPASMLITGIGLKKFPNYKRLSTLGIGYGILSYLFVFQLLSEPGSDYVGLYQLLIEGVFILWIISCTLTILNLKAGVDPGV